MTRHKKYLITAFFTLLLAAGVFAVSNVQAQGNVNLGLDYAANIGLGTRDIRDTIGSIIKTLLGLLGIIGVSLVLYGGFRWMTAAGEAKNVEAAKKIIINASIGTLIIISAYAITAFIFNQLGASIIGGGTGKACGTPGQPACSEDDAWSEFTAGCKEPTPITAGPFICRVAPKVVKAGEYLTIRGGKFGTFDEVKSGVFLYPDSGATKFTTTLNTVNCTGGDGCYTAVISSCGGNRTWRNYEIIVEVPVLKVGVTYKVAVINEHIDLVTNLPTVGDSSLRTSTNDAITFALGEPGPSLACLTPNEGSTADTVNNTAATSVIAEGKRFGATQVTSTLNFSTFNPDKLEISPLVNATVGNWTDTLLNSSVPNLSISGDVSVVVGGVKSNTSFFKVTCKEDNQCGAAGKGCCLNNGCVDPKWCEIDTPGKDCQSDKDCSDLNFCGTDNKCQPRQTDGQSCSTIATSCVPVQNCAVGSSCGTTGVTACICVANPVIYGFDPLDGATGTYLTIVGKNFGETGGTVKFQKTMADGTVVETAAGSVQCTGTDTWTDTEILVSIPSEFVALDSLSVKVIRAGDNKFAVSTGNFFTVNSLERPGLCTVYKELEAKTYNQALFGDPVLYEGANLGTQIVTPELLLTGASLEAVVPITAGAVIKGSVPNINPGTYKAQVRIQTVPASLAVAATETTPAVPAKPAVYTYSNSRDFIVSVPPVVPHINYVNEIENLLVDSGPAGQYVTLIGSGFGTQSGLAKIVLKTSTGSIITDSTDLTQGFFDFPEACNTDSTWTDGSITFKIPAGIDPAAVQVFVINSRDTLSDNSATLNICERGETCPLKPGICGISPNQGRPGLAGVQLIGEGFGSADDCRTATNCSVNFSRNEKITNTPATNASWLTLIQTWLNDFIGSNQNNSQIIVPQNASTGPVSVTVKGVTSNSINFTVADCTEVAVNFCTTATNPCCAVGPLKGSCVTPIECKPAQTLPSNLHYTFQTGDGQEQLGVPIVRESIQCVKDIQSPSPFLETTGNCVNAGLSASFVDNQGRPVQMEISVFNPENIKVYACGSTDEAFNNDNCLTTVEGVDANLFTNTLDIEPVSNNAAFLINLPPSTLDINTWYRVTLVSGATGIRSIYGLWLDGNRDGIGGENYSWSFAVGNDPKACEVSKTLVTPEEALMTTLEEKINYSALVMAVNCNLLNSSEFNWAWTSTLSNGNTGNGVAEISTNTNPRLTNISTRKSTDIDWKQVADPISQGVTYIGAQPYTARASDDNTSAFGADKKLSVNDLNNRLAVDLQIPEIWSISPEDGTTNPIVKNFISIFGKNFGASQGNSKVTFGDTNANLAECKLPWSDKRVMVRVPTAQEIPADGVKTKLTLEETGEIINQPTETTVLAMTFEETGSLAKDSVTEAIATFSSDLARSPSFLSGTALQFNADTAALVHPSLSLPVDSVKGLVKGAFEIWIKPTKATEAQTVMADQIIMKAVSAAGEFEISINGGDRAINITGPNNYTLSSTNNILEFDRAYNIIWNVGTTTSQLFINGNLVDTANTAPFFSAINLENQEISDILLGDYDESVNHFVGQMDNLAVYNEPLTIEEVAQHFGALTQSNGVVSLLHFEDEGETITDSSTNNLSIESANAPKSVDGVFGKGYKFNAGNSTSSNIQYLEINGNQTLLFPRGISVGAWVKTSDLSHPQVLVSHMVGNQGFELSLGGDSKCPANSACFKVGNEDGLSYAATLLPGLDAWHTNDWNWVLGTYDNKNIKIYINGSFISSYPVLSTELIAPTSHIIFEYPYAPTCIGTNLNRTADGALSCAPQILCEAGTTTCPTNFRMDEVFISNEALNDARIAQLAGTVFENNISFINVTTNRGVTPESKPFTNSNLIHPYICEVSPNFGPQDTPLNLGGFNFGDTFGETIAKVFFDLLSSDDQDKGVKIKDWTNTLIGLINPFGDVEASFYQIKVAISYLGLNPESNPVNFYFKPVITSISPEQGPGLQWMTVSGYNFGEYDADNAFDAGVYFDSAQGPIKAKLAPCATSWTSHEIVVEIPTDAVTGEVFVRSMNSNVDAPDLSSDPVDFTVTTDPVGAGLCPLAFADYLAGGIIDIEGVRFEARPTAPGADLAAVKLNGNVNLLQSIVAWSGVPANLETKMTITGNISAQRNDFKSGKIQYIKTVPAGEECIGFRIGTFCPGGTQVVNKVVASNAVNITAKGPYSCKLGNPVTEDARDAGWPKSIFYYGADKNPIDFQPFDVTNVVSDGTSLFARAWATNSFGTFGRGVFAKISSGYDDNYPGQLLNWYVSAGTNVETDIDDTRNLFLVDNKPAYINSDGQLKVVSLTEEKAVLTDVANFDPALIDLARTYTASTEVIGGVDGAFLKNGDSYAATSFGSTIINIGKDSTGYLLRTYKKDATTSEYLIEKRLTIARDNLFEIQSIFASDKYLYILGVGKMDVLNWNNGTFVDRVINLSNGTSKETGGFFDQTHKEIYTGALSVNGVGGNIQSGRIYKYAGCANGLTGISCSTSADCKLGQVCNAKQCVDDEDVNVCETDLDCTACAGARCDTTSNKCTPVITKVTPNKAPLGSWVTVHGCYFDDSGSVLFTKTGGTVEAIFPTEAICGKTWHPTYVVVEVPKKPEVDPLNPTATLVPSDDAITGPIKLVRGDEVEISTADLGLPNFEVGGTELPQVCAIDPIEVDRLDALQVKGRLGTYDPTLHNLKPINAVIYSGKNVLTDDVAVAVTSSSVEGATNFNNWTESLVKTIVPPKIAGTQAAVSGGVDVQTRYNTQVLMSDNQIPLTIYETNYGPQLYEGSPSITSREYDTCRNAMAVLKFTEPLKSETIVDSIKLFACADDATGVRTTPVSVLKKMWLAVLDMFGHTSNASLAPTPKKTCDSNDRAIILTDIQYEVIDGIPQVSISPRQLLAPEARYIITISEDDLEGVNGIHFNQQKSTKPESIEEPILNDPATGNSITTIKDVVFETQGEKTDDRSGICKFTDIRTTVFNQKDKLYGINQLGDAFFCAGDNCRMDIDFDQSAKPNNQHRYLAQGLSEIVTPTSASQLSDFSDDFAPDELVRDYSTTCTFGVAGNQAKLTSMNASGSCTLGIKRGAEFYGKRITLSADLMNTGSDYGLTLGGINAYRSILSNNKRGYVLEDGGDMYYETAVVGAVPDTSRWSLVYDAGSVMLKINGVTILTANSDGADSEMPIGLYTKNTSAVWDNLKVDTVSINYLVADISWSRTDELDPQRLIGLSNINAAELKDSFTSRTGDIHAEPKPIKQAQTKIAVEVSSPYPGANVLSKQFPITVFICQNPWITDTVTKDTEFATQGTYNFLTKYCRDAGDPIDLFDDLPSAEIIDASEIEEINAVAQAIIAAQQAVSGDLKTLEEINNAQKLFIAAQILVDDLSGTKVDLQAQLADVEMKLQNATSYPDLALTVAGKTSEAVEVPIVYTATVFNNGPSDATSFTVSVPVPANSVYVDGSSHANCNLNVGTVVCAFSLIEVGTSIQANIVFTGNVIGKMNMTYSVNTVSPAIDKNLGNNTRIISANITASSNLQVVAKTNAPNTWGVGDSLSVVSWTPTNTVAALNTVTDQWITNEESQGTKWVITNLGPSEAHDIRMEFIIPTEIIKDNATQFLTVTGVPNTVFSCKTIVNKFQCTADKLLKNNYLVVTLNAEALTPTANQIPLTLSATASETDVDPGNNSASYSIKIEPRADLSATLSLSDGPYIVGQNFTLTAGVTNAGPSASSPIITVIIPAKLTVDIANLAAQGCSFGSGNVTCNLASTAFGDSRSVTINAMPNVIIDPTAEVSISSTISSTVQDDKDTNDTASVTLSSSKKSDLALTISTSLTSVNVGSPQSIIFTVTNNNPLAQSPVDSTQVNINQITAFIVDSITPSHGSCDALTLPAAIPANFKCSMGTVTKDSAGIVTIVGHSTATSIPSVGIAVALGGSVISTQGTSQGEINTANNSATGTFTVLSLIDLAVSGTATPNPIKIDQQGTYLITVSNAAGLSDASSVSTTINLPTDVLTGPTVSTGTGGTSCTYPDTHTILCSTPTLAKGNSITISAFFTPDNALLTDSTIGLSAASVAQQTDSNSSNDGTSTTITLSALPPVVAFAQWNFDEGTSTGVSDIVGAAEGEFCKFTATKCPNNGLWNFDTIANRHSGKFDGANFVKITNTPELRLTQAFSIDLWIAPLAQPASNMATCTGGATSVFCTTGAGMIIDYSKAISPSLGWTMAYLSGGYINFQVSTESGSIVVTSAANAWALPGLDGVPKWTHVVGTFDSTVSADNIKLYINGVLNDHKTKASSVKYTYTSGGSTTVIDSFNIGESYAMDGRRPFRGLVDNVILYNRALSAREVTNLANQ